VFQPCNSAREAVLHRLAMRFRLSYAFDVALRRVTIRRPSRPAPVIPDFAPLVGRPLNHNEHDQSPQLLPTPGQPSSRLDTTDPIAVVACQGGHDGNNENDNDYGIDHNCRTPRVAFATVPVSESASTPAASLTTPNSASGPFPLPTLPNPSHSQAHHHRLSLSTSTLVSSPFSTPSFSPAPFPSSPFQTSSPLSASQFAHSPFIPSTYLSPDVASFLPRQATANLDSVVGVGLKPDWSSQSSLTLSRTSTSSSISAFSSPTGSLSPTAQASSTFATPARSEFLHSSATSHAAVGVGLDSRAVPHGRDRPASRIGDSISQRVSTWKIFSGTSKSLGIHRGRKGPLNTYSRDKMRALEQVGGACWRCKVIRRKVV